MTGKHPPAPDPAKDLLETIKILGTGNDKLVLQAIRHALAAATPAPAPAAFRVNMLRLAPSLSHEQIDQLAEQARQERSPVAGDAPLGAAINGRVYADRLEQAGLECEAGKLDLCADWVEFRRCFEALAEWAMHTAPQAPQRAELTDEKIEEIALQQGDCDLHDGCYIFNGRGDWTYSLFKFARSVIAADRAIRTPGMGARMPLTPEQVKAVCIDAGYWSCNEGSRADFMNGLRHGEIAHGIGVDSKAQVTGSGQ